MPALLGYIYETPILALSTSIYLHLLDETPILALSTSIYLEFLVLRPSQPNIFQHIAVHHVITLQVEITPQMDCKLPYTIFITMLMSKNNA